MDDAWRFRAIPDRQNCPVCLIPHYPFCPHPPAFFGDDHRHFLHCPFYDPSPHPPHPPHPPFPPFPPPPPRPPSHPPPFLLEEIRERESFPKRMRVEDSAIGAFFPFQPFSRSLSFDDERRLNLIRDHGKQDISPVQEERLQINRDYLMDWHHVEGLGSQFSSGDHDFPKSAFGHPNGPKSTFGHRNGHFQASKAHDGYQNEQIPILEMEERFWSHERRDFDRVELAADRRGIFKPQMVGHSHALQMPRFHGSGEALGGSENFIFSAQGEASSNGSWRLASYSAIDDNSLRVGSFHKQQQAQPMLSSSHLLPKLHPHPHTDTFDMVPSHQDHATQKHLESNSEFYEWKGEMMRASFELRPPIPDEIHKPFDAQAYQAVLQLGHHTSKQAGCTPLAEEVTHVIGTTLPSQGHTSQAYSPIPPQPLFPIQTEASLSAPQVTSSVSATVSIVSPVVADTSAKRQLSAYDSQILPQGVLYNEPPVQAYDGFANEGSPFIRQTSLNLDERGLSFLVKHSGKERPAYVDASHLFKQPYRASRPDHIVIILRGLPGSGKSYLAKALRDIEVENGGCAPRIHAMDDYFMIEVEKKVEDNEGFKSSGSVRSKKQVTKKVIEYCYEPEMEEAYRSSMLKAFKKTLDDGIFTFVIVDDRNLRVADFALFWAIAKRSGYEVYLLEATYKDPAGCAARNIHGFKLVEIQKMAKQWEEAPPLYLHLDIQPLFGGDDLNEQYIQEVDMDGDDTRDGEAYHLQETDDCKSTEPKLLDQFSDHGSTKLGKRWNTEEEEEEKEEKEVEFAPVNNELQKGKWSMNLDVDVNGSKSAKGNTSALSGLIQAYGKGVKCVHWGDRDEMSGFSIGAIKKRVSSLIIGPGAGYNLKSNPLLEDDPVGDATGKISHETKGRFNEQLRAERESFRAIFDRRRHRIIGLWDADDE